MVCWCASCYFAVFILQTEYGSAEFAQVKHRKAKTEIELVSAGAVEATGWGKGVLG